MTSMFEARLARGGVSILNKILTAIEDLIDEVTLDCSATGIHFQAMDDSYISLVTLTLWSKGFEKFRCDKNISMGINTCSLSKIINCAGNDDVITIKARDGDDVVSFVFETQNHQVSHYEIKLMNLNTKRLEIPETDHSVVVEMSSMTFQSICKNLNQINNSVIICCTENVIKFSVYGDLRNRNVTLSQITNNVDKENKLIIIKMQKPVALIVDLRFLDSFTNATPLSTRVQLSLYEGLPLMVEYKIEDMGFLRYYLSPKIEDETSVVCAA